MKTIEGYNVKIYTDNIEDSASEQIKELLSVDVFSKCKIRIMPDVHAGAGCGILVLWTYIAQLRTSVYWPCLKLMSYSITA